MKNLTPVFVAVPLTFLACAQKPKIAARTTPPAVVSTASEPTAVTAPETENAREKIKALLDEAFKPVYFPFDQATLSEASKSLLTQAGSLLQQQPSISVLIKGNTDERGTEEYNLALGERRAEAVKAYLAAYGIDGARLKIISYGKEKPAVAGHDESAWAMNRRDDFNVDF